MEQKPEEEAKADVLIRCNRRLDEPSPDFREHSHILDGLRGVLHPAHINHNHITCQPRVLHVDATCTRGFPSLR